MYLGSCFKHWVKILPTFLAGEQSPLSREDALGGVAPCTAAMCPVLLLQLAVVVITHLHFILQYTQTYQEDMLEALLG